MVCSVRKHSVDEVDAEVYYGSYVCQWSIAVQERGSRLERRFMGLITSTEERAAKSNAEYRNVELRLCDLKAELDLIVKLKEKTPETDQSTVSALVQGNEKKNALRKFNHENALLDRRLRELEGVSVRPPIRLSVVVLKKGLMDRVLRSVIK